MQTYFSSMLKSMPSIRSSLLHFLLWLVFITIVFGLLAMLCSAFNIGFLSQAFSLTIMLPYMISFYEATRHFIKKYSTVPTKKQRWLFSLGCLIIFWAYSILAGLVGFWLSGASFNSEAIGQMSLMLMLFGLCLILFNAVIVIIGYCFLGKPADIMLEHHQRK